jgi:hypothetical protein
MKIYSASHLVILIIQHKYLYFYIYIWLELKLFDFSGSDNDTLFQVVPRATHSVKTQGWKNGIVHKKLENKIAENPMEEAYFHLKTGAPNVLYAYLLASDSLDQNYTCVQYLKSEGKK